MAARAPGQLSPQVECYNCGSTTHWFPACPEPTRSHPCGLQRWKVRNKDSKPGPDRRNENKDKKGPLVERYPPPPSFSHLNQAPPVLHYGQPPQPAPYAPGQQEYDAPPYPPPGPPGSSFLPPPPQYGQLPPRPSIFPPQYGQFGQSPFPLPFAAPPQPYSSGAYPQAFQYHAAFPAALVPSPPFPAAGPLQLKSVSQVPFLPPPPGLGSYPHPPPWKPQSPAQESSAGQYSCLHTKNHMRDRGDKCQRQRSQHWDSRVKGDEAWNESTQQVRKNHDRDNRKSPKESRCRDASSKREKESGDGEWSFGSKDDLEAIFGGTKIKATADPVGIPLPCIYNENPTIPPAYDAKCIKSAFFNESNVDEFCKSIRDYDGWPTAQKDPAFSVYSEMIIRRFGNYDHEYPTYVPAPLPGPDEETIVPPPIKFDRHALQEEKDAKERQAAEEQRAADDERKQSRGFGDDSRMRRSRDRSQDRDYEGDCSRNRVHDSSNYSQHSGGRKASGKRRVENDRLHSDRDVKRYKRSPSPAHTPLRTGSRDKCLIKASPAVAKINNTNPWSVQPGESDLYRRSPNNKVKRMGSSSERVPSIRNDSGYHSGQSSEPGSHKDKAAGARDRDNSRDRVGRARKRPFQESRHQSYRSNSKRNRRLNHSLSQTRDRGLRRRWPASSDEDDRSDDYRGRSAILSRSRSDSRDRSRSASPLTGFEAELLGLVGENDKDSDGERGPRSRSRSRLRMRKTKKAPPRKNKPVKVAAVYDRRW